MPYYRLLLILLISFLSCLNLNSQNTVGTISISDDVFDGFTLFSIHKKTYLINNCGEIINEWTSLYEPGNSVYLLPNGNILRAGEFANGSNLNFGGMGGIIEVFDWDGNIVWSYIYSNNEHRQHHDVFPMPNGNVLILAATPVDLASAIQAGRDPMKLSDNELYNEQIIEVEPVGTNQGNIVWEWNIMDHLVQDFDPNKDHFGIISNFPRKLNINFLNGFDDGKNWLHVNSIQYEELRDQIVISSRRMSELWIIDHSTTTAEASTDNGGIYGHGGDFLYRWGNPQAYNRGYESDRTLYGQHMPYIIPEGLPNAGKIMVFNNGFGRTPSFSEIYLIEPPISSPGVYTFEANTTFGPPEAYFSYPEMPPTEDSDFFSAIVSSAQQLPNGNILVCEGREGHFFELDENNNIVWDYISPISSDNGIISEQFSDPPLNKIIFRALKYDINYQAFENRDLTPSGTIELNPNILPCQQALNLDSADNLILNIYPNPTKGNLEIKLVSNLTVNSIEIYNMLGEKILENAEQNSMSVNKLKTGIYLAYITIGNRVTVKKIIKN